MTTHNHFYDDHGVDPRGMPLNTAETMIEDVEAVHAGENIADFVETTSPAEIARWHAQRVDGNDLDAVVAALDAARALEGPRPRVVIFDTRMGRGVPFLEARERNHFLRVEPGEWALALEAVEAGGAA